MSCRQPSAREIVAIETSIDVSNAANRIGITNSSLQEFAAFDPLPEADFPAAGVDLNVVTRGTDGQDSTDILSADHYTCAFSALGLGESASGVSDTAELQRQVRHFSGPRFTRERLQSGLGELEVIEYFRRDPTSTLGGANTDDNSNHISPEEWNTFIDARMRIEPSLVISSQPGTVNEDGEEIEGNVRYETDAEKRNRISQREWRQLENFLRFTQYYSGDTRMGSLVARYIARNEAVTQGNAFFASISQGLSTRASNVNVWNFQRGGGTLSVSLVGLSEYLVPNNDPNRDICANTNHDQTWAASTQACNALIWTANQNAVYRQARERALVAQRDALRNRVNTHISYELLGGAMLAGVTVGGALWLRARVRASTERELTERIRDQERASLLAEMGESLRGLNEELTVARSGLGTTPPSAPGVVSSQLANAARHVEGIERALRAVRPSPTAPTTNLTAPAAAAARAATSAPSHWYSPRTWGWVRSLGAYTGWWI